MIDWWRFFQVSVIIWAAGVAVFMIAFALLLSGLFEEDDDPDIPASRWREVREGCQKIQGRIALTIVLWPVMIPLLEVLARRRRKKRREQAAEIFGWKRK